MISSDKFLMQNLMGKEISIRWNYCKIPIINLMSPERVCSIRTTETEYC